MRKHDTLNIRSGTDGSAQPPKAFYQGAIDRLRQTDSQVEASFGPDGRVRTIMSGSATGLFTLPFSGDPLAHAKKFLSTPSIVQTLGLRNVDLHDGVTDTFNFGGIKVSRVAMSQTVKLADGTELPVRNGFVHVTMDGGGKVLNVASTVKFGRRPTGLPKAMLTREQAIEVCRTKLGADSETSDARLVLSEHEGKMGLVYEVKLVNKTPRHAMFYLVLAKTGEIVYENSMIKTSAVGKAQDAVNRIPVRCFLAIPDPKKPIPQQVVDHYIESLPDPSLLQDHRFVLKVKEGGQWVVVKANKDGNFKFDSDKESSKFSAVVTYVALRAQYEFLEELGMKKQTRPIQVFIDDPDVQDNAYFDPENYEIHMGVGSGGSWGLSVHISFDLGVEWHENGHHVVYLQCPAQDLPGSEGAAMHESTGDVLGQIVMQYLWGVLYGKQLGNELTLAQIKADKRIIGFYAMPPNGIRQQRNTKKTPKDKKGEPHDDGEISGAAHADLLEAMIVKAVGDGKTIKDGIVDFSKLYLAALALVPASTVRFADMLRAMLTADTTLYSGAYAALITKAHADHGITTGGGKATGDVTIDIDGGDDTATTDDGAKTGGNAGEAEELVSTGSRKRKQPRRRKGSRKTA